VIATSIAALAGSGEDRLAVVFNSSPYAIDRVPAFGAGQAALGGDARIAADGAGYVLENEALRIRVDGSGLIPSIVELTSAREVLPPGARANLLQVFRDTPAQWDAWDVDVEYRRSGEDLTALDSLDVVADGPEAVALRVVRSFGDSSVVQTLTLRAGAATLDIETEVEWHERQRMLKLAVPVDVHTASARSEIQFGHIERATHTNTSWDTARFETPAHRWVHVSDAGFGVGVANDSTYGHDVTRHARDGGGTYSVVRQTLLRAPLFPDPEADQGRHVLRSAIVVGGVGDAIEEGYRLNLPMRAAAGAAVEPLIASTSPAIVVETVKLAEDGSGDVIARLYEAHGSRATGTIGVGFDHAGVVETDLLEREQPAVAVVKAAGPAVDLSLRPFQLVTLRFARG
jgi:alpha-mannosidase